MISPFLGVSASNAIQSEANPSDAMAKQEVRIILHFFLPLVKPRGDFFLGHFQKSPCEIVIYGQGNFTPKSWPPLLFKCWICGPLNPFKGRYIINGKILLFVNFMGTINGAPDKNLLAKWIRLSVNLQFLGL